MGVLARAIDENPTEGARTGEDARASIVYYPLGYCPLGALEFHISQTQRIGNYGHGAKTHRRCGQNRA